MHGAAQEQSGPQAHLQAQAPGGQVQPALQPQDLVLASVVILELPEFPVGDDRCSRQLPSARLERNSYVMRRLAGATPNIRRNVRLKWAESANPASCAASVSDAPAAAHATARVSLSHRR